MDRDPMDIRHLDLSLRAPFVRVTGESETSGTPDLPASLCGGIVTPYFRPGEEDEGVRQALLALYEGRGRHPSEVERQRAIDNVQGCRQPSRGPGFGSGDGMTDHM